MTEALSFRSVSPGEAALAAEIAGSAFGPSERRLEEIRRYLGLKPNHWVMALYQGQPAGVLGATDYGSFVYLGMMTVRREHQRRGIGTALMGQVMSWAETAGKNLLRLDATDAGYPLYRRFGFRVVDQALAFRPSRVPWADEAPDTSTETRILTLEDLPEVAAMDRPIFGADRTHLLQALFRDFPERALGAFDSSGRIQGFLVAQKRRLGPWVARTPTAARALLTYASMLPFPGRPLLVVPGLNSAARSLLTGFQFELEREGRHMQWSASPTAVPGDRSAVYGQTSFAIG